MMDVVNDESCFFFLPCACRVRPHQRGPVATCVCAGIELRGAPDRRLPVRYRRNARRGPARGDWAHVHR